MNFQILIPNYVTSDDMIWHLLIWCLISHPVSWNIQLILDLIIYDWDLTICAGHNQMCHMFSSLISTLAFLSQYLKVGNCFMFDCKFLEIICSTSLEKSWDRKMRIHMQRRISPLWDHTWYLSQAPQTAPV